jgi:heme exporter protein A
LLDVVHLACTRGDRPLFRNLSFHLEPGQLLHVQGPNGSGKTTLLRSLCGLTQPAGGEIRWDGRPVSDDPGAFRGALCYVGHANALHGELTGIENLDFETCLAGDSRAEARQALTDTGLARTADLPTKLLSQGQKRRTALARLLVHEKPLWVLDEPLTALDVRASAALLNTFAAHLRRGGLIILTSHQEIRLPDSPILNLALEGT